MRAGFGRMEITPPLGVELTGYGYYLERRATGVLDPLYARALALEENEEKYLLISCDLLGLNKGLVKQVQQAMEQEYGLSPDHMMIVSIHTHTGPSMKYHEGCGEVDPDVVAGMPALIAQAARLAMADLALVTNLSYSIAPIEGKHAYNRTAENGPVDDQVRSFRMLRKNAPEIALVSYACHAVSRGHISLISADYPGQVCRMLEEKGLLPIYINGLCGDIDPAPCEDEERPEKLMAFAKAITEAENKHAQPLPPTLSGGRIHMELRLMEVTKEDIQITAERAMARPEEIPGGRQVAAIWHKEMLARFDSLKSTEDISIAYLKIGGVIIVALPFEGFTLTGQLIRKELSDPRTVTLGCAEELLGYLPTRDDIARGAYAALESTFLYKRLPGLPGEAERFGEETGRLLKNA